MHRVRAGGDRSVWAVQDFDRVVERASLPDDFHLREHAREHRHHAARPHGPEDVADTFAYIRAMQADDIDMACAAADDTGPELHRLLLDVAARLIIPVTAVDDCDGEPLRALLPGSGTRPAPAEAPLPRRVPGQCAGRRRDHHPLHRQHPHRRRRRRRRRPAPTGGRGDEAGDGTASRA